MQTQPSFCVPILMDVGLFGIAFNATYIAVETELKKCWLTFGLALILSLMTTVLSFSLIISVPLILSHSKILLLSLGAITSLISFPMTTKKSKEEAFTLMLFWLLSFFFGIFLMSLYFAPHLN